jgi:hypothetical protein
MLLYIEVPLAELTRGDRIAVEVDGVDIPGFVVGTNLEYGTLGFWPSIGRESDSEVFTVEPGKRGVKVLKQIDSEAAVTEPFTWERIAEWEPRVLTLLNEIRTERPHEHNYFLVWRKYKERLSELVGWGRTASVYAELRSSVAYNIVYYKLSDNLKVPE